MKTSAVIKYDVAVPVKNMVSFLNEVEALFKKENYKVDLYLFGHFGDGSPHLNLLQLKDTTKEQFEAECKKIETSLFPLIKKHQGSASAEHGIGILKKSWLTYSRSSEELQLFKAIKKAFRKKSLEYHPDKNPGKVCLANSFRR